MQTPAPTDAKKNIIIYPPFIKAYEEYKAALGQPLIEMVEVKNVYKALHQHATIVWINYPVATFYRLKEDDQTWDEKNEESVDSVEHDPRWRTKVFLQQKFQPTQGLEPPYSGVAFKWTRNEKDWSWIGFRYWHCFYKTVHYQKFEHGLIMDGIPRSDSGDPQLYILMDSNHQWKIKLQEDAQAPTVCIPPVEF